MKKLITQRRWKDYLAKRSESQLKANARFAEYRRNKNRAKLGRPQLQRFPKRKTITLAAPRVFSMVKNPGETVGLLNNIRRSVRNGNVFVDLSQVQNITPDAIAGLLSTIHHPDIGDGLISGNAPEDPSMRRILNESGFRQYVKSDADLPHRASLGKIQRHSRSQDILKKKYDQFVAQELVEFAVEKLTGFVGNHPPSYGMLGDAMLNTMQHASPQGRPDELWWASVYFDSERNVACFTFIDQGVGIFKSRRLPEKIKLLGKLAVPTNTEILRRLFRGEIPSTTDEPGRGHGIPGMYAHCKRGTIREFAILSNDVIGNAESETYSAVSSHFGGTLLYWEMKLP